MHMVLFFVVLLLFLLWFPCLYHECHGNENIGGVSLFVHQGIFKRKVGPEFDIGDTDAEL